MALSHPEAAMPAKTLHDQFVTVVWLVFRRVTRRLQTRGLTHPQFMILAALVKHQQPATMRQLTEVTFQDAPTTTGVVNRLVKMGLVCRTRTEEDRRVVWVEATPAGKALIGMVKDDFECTLPAPNEFLDAHDLARAEELLDYFLTILMKEDYEHSNADAQLARKWLQAYVCDPIGFIKERQNETAGDF